MDEGVLCELGRRVKIELHHDLRFMKFDGLRWSMRVVAISLTVFPSATSCNTSRWRAVKDLSLRTADLPPVSPAPSALLPPRRDIPLSGHGRLDGLN